MREFAMDPSLLDLFPATDGVLPAGMYERICDAIDGLPQVQQDLVNGVFWEQQQLQRVAYQLRIDPPEAKQLLEEALDVIRGAVQVPEPVGPLPAATPADLGAVPVPQRSEEGQ